MPIEHSHCYESSQAKILDAAMRSIDAALDVPIEIPNNDAARACLAAARAAHAKSKAIAERSADAVKPNEAERLAIEARGPSWGLSARKHAAVAKRRARLAFSRPRNAIEAKAYRARQRIVKQEEAKAIASLLIDLAMPVPEMDEAELVVVEIELDGWLALKGPRQRQIAPLRASLLASRMLLLAMRAERLTGEDPGPTEFAKRLAAIGIAMDRRQSFARMKMIQSLEKGDGPWRRRG